jgi:FKBP-type peptidyl-prolyl cis-trans isomerase
MDMRMTKLGSMLLVAVTLAAGPLGSAKADENANERATESKATPAAGLVSEKDRVSYSVGMQTGRALRTADGAEVNLEALVKGLKDGLDGARAAIPEREMSELLGKFQQSLRQKMAASRGRAKVENLEKANRFFEQNKARPGVVTTATGVQYEILKAGNGPLPQEEDVVTVNYRGTLLNGSEFDATPPGRPAALAVGKLIAGWKQVLKVMPVGSHWKVYIPPSLAYGERGVGADIGPNETLVFDLELLDTKIAKD